MPATESRLQLTHKLQRLNTNKINWDWQATKEIAYNLYTKIPLHVYFLQYSSHISSCLRLYNVCLLSYKGCPRSYYPSIYRNSDIYYENQSVQQYNETDVLLYYSGILGLQLNFDNFNLLYFQHDGASSHYRLHSSCTKYLDEVFQRQVIGRWRAIEMPPRSSDLTLAMDSFLKGFVKDKVYATNPQTIEELK